MDARCLEALAAHALKQLPLFNEQEMASMLWAFAKLNYSPKAALLQGCEEHATRIAETIKPQGLVRCCLL